MNKYNTFGARFAAALIDGLIFLPLGFLNTLLSDKINGSVVLLILWTVVYLSLYQFYAIFMHGKYGQTIGKSSMNVMIVTYPEELPITYRHAFIRDLPYTVLVVADIIIAVTLILKPGLYFNTNISFVSEMLGYAAILWFFVEIISMSFNDKKRAVHDLIAKTVVINV